jgi:hypothetical protein
VDVSEPLCWISYALFAVVSVKLKMQEKGLKNTAAGH